MSFLTAHTTARQRNILGCIAAFILSCLLNIIGTGIMAAREFHQSEKYGFPVEKDDLVRYTAWGLLGCVVNTLAITFLILKSC